MEVKVINTRTAGSLTTYELRQELVRRGAFDLDEQSVCYNSLLKRLMTELIADESLEDLKRATNVIDDANVAREIAKQVREEKKKEAVERSRQRQSDPQYFERILENNKKPTSIATADSDNDNDANAEKSQSNEVEDDGGQNDQVFDPFRPSYADKDKKNKIFVR